MNNCLQFNEYYHERTGLTTGIRRILFAETSPYQTVEVFETDSWGNMLVIDGMVMLSEKDEFVYHEMLTHVAMFSHPNPRRVLIIGGGDGGTAREVLRHPAVESVDMVEIDETVVRAAKLHFPEVGVFGHPKLNVMFEDGVRYVAENSRANSYDVVIIDGSDPVGPALDLFGESFYLNCYRILGEQGVLATQTESPWVSSYHESMKKLFTSLGRIFEVSRMYLAHIPLYPSGMWSMAYASKGIQPDDPQVLERVETGTRSMSKALRYYNRDIHRACFALPGFVQELVVGSKPGPRQPLT